MGRIRIATKNNVPKIETINVDVKSRIKSKGSKVSKILQAETESTWIRVEIWEGIKEEEDVIEERLNSKNRRRAKADNNWKKKKRRK